MNKRFVGKISVDSSVDGLIDLIAKMAGKDPSEVQLSDETLARVKSLQEEKIKNC